MTSYKRPIPKFFSTGIVKVVHNNESYFDKWKTYRKIMTIQKLDSGQSSKESWRIFWRVINSKWRTD